MSYWLEVQAPGSPAEQHELAAGTVTIGSGEGAGLRLAGSAFQPQHLAVQVLPEGARVQLLDAVEGSITFEGSQVRDALVPWGGEVFVSGVRLSFLATGERKRTVHPLLLLALAGALVGVAWRGGGAVADAGATTTIEPPALTLPAAPCPEPDASVALARASKEERAAHAKWERYPFDASEGLRALRHVQVASACLEAAGAANELARTEQQRVAWQGTLSQDLAAWRLRLDRALSQDRPAEALAAVKGLEALLTPLGDGAYQSWLRDQRHRLERKQAR